MQDEAIYRCVNAACARAMPRRVNYCPYCGMAQAPGAPPSMPDDGRRRRDAAAAGVAAPSAAAPSAAASAAATAGPEAAALSGWSDAPDAGPAADAAAAAAAAPSAAAPSARAGMAETRPSASAAPTPSATAFGHSGRPVDGGTATPERVRGIPWPPPPPAPTAANKPAGRQPIRLRWWIVVLAVLWGVWLWARPSAQKIERRIDAAIVMARECKGKEAQDELIALRAGRATPRQLGRLQRALNEASNACTRRRQRAAAWAEARGPIESALADGSVERARTRLQAFTKRWGEDDDTRALKARIDALRREHPLAVPPAAGTTP